MRKILAAAAVLAVMTLPTTATTARTQYHQCDSASIEAAMCGMDYEVDLSICDLSPPGEQGGCRGEALGRWSRCMSSC